MCGLAARDTGKPGTLYTTSFGDDGSRHVMATSIAAGGGEHEFHGNLCAKCGIGKRIDGSSKLHKCSKCVDEVYIDHSPINSQCFYKFHPGVVLPVTAARLAR